MALSPEVMATINKSRSKIKAAETDMENAIALLEPIVYAALKRDDTTELKELVKCLPSAFWRAEIRGVLINSGRWES